MTVTNPVPVAEVTIHYDNSNQEYVAPTNASGNTTLTNVGPPCKPGMAYPTAEELFTKAPPVSIVILIILIILALLTLLIYLEEINYIMKHFKSVRGRKMKTIWILGVYPVFSLTGLIAVIIPKSGVMVDLVAQVFFGTCVYQYMALTVDYLGGYEKMYGTAKGAMANLRSPPCCCCCPCLPTLPFVKPVFKKLQIMALQVAIVRPVLFFLAAVLWTNGNYRPGAMMPNQIYFYITVINLASTLTGIYALVVTQRALAPILMKFRMIPKFLNYPLLLLFTSIPNIVINVMVMNGAIPCTPILPSKARGERIYHAFLVIIMVLFSLFGRRLYRRRNEAELYGEPFNGPPGDAGALDRTSPGDLEKAPLREDENMNPEKPPPSSGDAEKAAYKIEDYITAKTSNM